MRLICPNCGAQYEVPDEVIPENGRDVQCSNCGDTWFQHHPDHPAPEPETDPAPAPEPAPQEQPVTWDTPEETTPEASPENEPEPEPEPQPAQDESETAEETDATEGDSGTATPAPEPKRRQLDPAIADVLREEAEHEREARAAETGGGLESQPDLGLTQDHVDEDKRTRESRARMARLRGEDDTESEPPASVPDAADIDPSSRRNLLPDIDEINSSLDADSHAPAKESQEHDEWPEPDHTPRKRGGFKRGFSYAVLLALILLGVYLFAPRIAEMVPALAGPLETYVEQVNALRVMLDEQFGWVGDWLNDMSSPPVDGSE